MNLRHSSFYQQYTVPAEVEQTIASPINSVWAGADCRVRVTRCHKCHWCCLMRNSCCEVEVTLRIAISMYHLLRSNIHSSIPAIYTLELSSEYLYLHFWVKYCFTWLKLQLLFGPCFREKLGLTYSLTNCSLTWSPVQNMAPTLQLIL